MTNPEFTLDWPHGWQTRDGRDVVIYCTDAPGAFPIHGRLNDIWRVVSWEYSGKCRNTLMGNGSFDLINRPIPSVSVPVDKLHDGTMIESLALNRAIIVHKESELKGGSSRPVKWFYADEVEIKK